jgi:Lipoprotein LpqB beta-propeller domain.
MTIPAGAAGDYDPDVLSARPEAYFIKDGRLYGLIGNDTAPQALGPPVQKAREINHPAISGDAMPKVAALSNDGVVVTSVDGRGQWERWIRGTALTSPSWDRYGEVWSVERVDSHRSRVWHSSGGQATQMRIPELEKTDVSALKVARDGVRVAVALDDGAGQQVRIGAIDRDNNTMGGWQTLDATADGAEVVDLAWQDARTLLVLTKDNKQNRELTAWNVTDGTQQTSNVPKSDARIRTITAAPDGRLLAGADEDGEILVWEPDKKKDWQTLITGGAITPAYPLG